MDTKNIVSFDQPVKDQPIPTNLPKTLNEVKRIQMENKYANNPDLTPEQKERLIKLEEAIRNSLNRSKSDKQKAKEKRLSKIANASKRKNRT